MELISRSLRTSCPLRPSAKDGIKVKAAISPHTLCCMLCPQERLERTAVRCARERCQTRACSGAKGGGSSTTEIAACSLTPLENCGAGVVVSSSLGAPQFHWMERRELEYRCACKTQWCKAKNQLVRTSIPLLRKEKE